VVFTECLEVYIECSVSNTVCGTVLTAVVSGACYACLEGLEGVIECLEVVIECLEVVIGNF